MPSFQSHHVLQTKLHLSHVLGVSSVAEQRTIFNGIGLPAISSVYTCEDVSGVL
jgi:hypothetical protein